MAKRKVQLGVTCVVADPTTSTKDVLDSLGNVVKAGTVGTRHIPPGEWIDLDEDEADRLEARFPYQVFEVTRDANAAVKKAEALTGRQFGGSARRG